LGNDLVRRCGGEWGPCSPRRQTRPSLQVVDFKMSERGGITTAQRVVTNFLTNENFGPNEIWRRLRAQYGGINTIEDASEILA
jgi:hypothetical protein